MSSVRTCERSISRSSEVINAANATLEKLNRPDAGTLESMSAEELRLAKEIVSQAKILAYLTASESYALRGIALSKTNPRKARQDCEKADEIRRYLRENDLKPLFQSVKQKCRNLVVKCLNVARTDYGLKNTTPEMIVAAIIGSGTLPKRWPEDLKEEYNRAPGRDIVKDYKLNDAVEAVLGKHPALLHAMVRPSNVPGRR